MKKQNRLVPERIAARASFRGREPVNSCLTNLAATVNAGHPGTGANGELRRRTHTVDSAKEKILAIHGNILRPKSVWMIAGELVRRKTRNRIHAGGSGCPQTAGM